MPFRRVDGNHAGPEALGILVPPGRRTVVIVRPRSLVWDLVPVNPRTVVGPRFWEVGRLEGNRLAEQIFTVLAEGEPVRVEPIAAADGNSYEIRAAVGPFVLLACGRVPGQPYQPQLFASSADAEEAARRIAACLGPADEQEVYFNTRHFAPHA